ncbi:MAG: hypothetical protein GX093_04205 [Xanthomonadaceae bacterium]|nr:hypothetical protein [Xanthomonadaceae bacterium]
MNLLQPRRVEANAPWRWVREAFALIGRRPAAFGLTSLVMLALFFAALEVEQTQLRFLIALLLPPFGIGSCLRLAEAADRSRPVTPLELLPTNREVVQILGIMVLGYGFVFALIVAASAGGWALEPGTLADERWRNYVDAAATMLGLPVALAVKGVLFGISLAAFACILLVAFAWFALPLSQLCGLPTLPALRLSFSAYRLNAHRIGLASVATLAAMAALVLLSLGLAAVLAAPFLGAMLYVSYREVFLGQAENSPARATAGLGVAEAAT